MSQDKKNKILTLGAVVLLGLIAIGVTFAFFRGSIAGDTEFVASVTTNTTDSLMFNIDNDISITATTSNFEEGMGNQSGVANAKAILKANNKTNSATKNYYLYLDIKENELTYTRDDKTAELLLQVSGPDGLVTTINGLNYVTVTDGKGEQVSGFDITEVQDLITIVNNKEITTTSEKTDSREVKVIFVNLDTDQKANGGKRFNAKLEIQKEGKTLGEVCAGKNMAQCMSKNYELDNHLLHHTSELANSAGDNSYRYSGSYENVENYVCFGYDGDGECPHDNLYRIIGIFGDQLKLIKADYAKVTELGTSGDYKGTYSVSGTNKGWNTKEEIGGYSWNNINGSNSKNTWSDSRLNTANLNDVYLNKFSEDWQEKIATNAWKVGGTTYENIINKNAREVFQNEINVPSINTIYTSKIGLMYVSDYMYGASLDNWIKLSDSSTTDDYRSAVNLNWMYNGLLEWTITRNNSLLSNAFGIGDIGIVYGTWGISGNYIAVRPVFYLESNIILLNGTGKKSDPYKIKSPNLGEECIDQNLAQCLKDNYEMDSHLLHHDASLENGAGDNSVRYAGSY